MTTLHLPEGVLYDVDDDLERVRSRFPDGSEVWGHASFRDEDHARAVSLGYGRGRAAVWRMHREHDLAHHLVAQALGWPYSIVLHRAANRLTGFPVGVYATEERMSFLVQRAANVGVCALIDNAGGPS